MGQRGYTLVELAIVVAIASMVLLSGGALWMGRRADALGTSVQLFDGVLHHAQALAAASGNGATIVVAPRADGATLYVYAGRPNVPGSMAEQGPPVDIEAGVREPVLGSPPFSVFLNSAGHATGLAAYPDYSSGSAVFAPVAAEPACPGSGGYTLVFSSGGASESRSLACSVSAPGAPDPVSSPPPAATPTP